MPSNSFLINIKHFIKRRVLRSNLVIFILRAFNFLNPFFSRIPHILLEAEIKNKLTIKNGPFKGMVYPREQAWGEVFNVILLGLYEQHLHKHIESFKKKKYESILNIGSAEGYYTIGCALIFPDTKVFGVDIDQKSLEFCKEFAIKNNVEKFVDASHTDAKKLIRTLNKDLSYLIFCDCEGGEFSIFDDENLQILRKSDLIIEMHYKNYELQKKEFMSKFEHTHNLIVEKTNRPGGENYVEDYDFLKNIPVKFAKKFSFVPREVDAEWFILKAKNKN